MLSAVPGVLTKKPTTLGPILKRICNLIAQSQSENDIQDTSTSTSTSTSTTPSVSRSPMSKKQLHRALNILLLDAPSILKKKPADVDIRLQQLADLLKFSLSKEIEVSHSTPDTSFIATTTPSPQSMSMNKAKMLVVKVPRLLIETKIDRPIFRSRLLQYYENSFCKPLTNHGDTLKVASKIKKSKIKSNLVSSANEELGPLHFFDSIIEKCPQILAGPSSTLARLFFSSTIYDGTRSILIIPPVPISPSTPTHPKITGLSKVITPLTVEQVSNLLDCNTKSFLFRLSGMRAVDIETVDVAYGLYLRNLIERITASPHAPIKSTPSSTPTSTSPVLKVLFESHDEKTLEVDEVADTDMARNVNGGISNSVPSTPIQTSDLGSSELERMLCGVLNDICSGPITQAQARSQSHSLTGTSDNKIISLNQQHTNTNLTVTGSDILCIDMEIKRMDLICQQIGIFF